MVTYDIQGEPESIAPRKLFLPESEAGVLGIGKHRGLGGDNP
jgi:hypothetical protein